jgi:hypothetical protein
MKHSIKLEVYYSGSWHDVTAMDELLTGVTLAITRTAAGVTESLTPSTVQGQLLSTSGKWHPLNPMSELYGILDLCPPARVTIDTSLRWTGTLSRLAPTRPNGGVRRVNFSGGGAVRSINIGTMPLISALTSTILAMSPTVYLPLIDGPLATLAGTPIASGTAGDLHGVRFGQVDGPAGDTRKLPEFVGDSVGGDVAWSVDINPPTPTSWTIDLAVKGTRQAGAFSSFDILSWRTAPDSDTEVYWQLGVTYNGGASDPDDVRLFGYAVYGSPFLTLDLTSKVVLDGLWHYVRVSVSSTAGTTTATVRVDGTSVSGSATMPAGGIGQIGFVSQSPSVLKSGSVGHVAVYPSSAPASTYSAFQGWVGETTVDRFDRLCTEQGIDDTPMYWSDTPMGAQPVGTIGDVLMDIVRTDGGLLFEDPDGTLRFRSVGWVYNTTGTQLSVNDDLRPPLEQIIADRVVRNDVTASRAQGSSARYEVTTGPMAVTSGYGRIAATVNVNPQDDDSLSDYAAFYAHAWTLNEAGYGKIVVYCDAADLPLATVNGIDIGSVITLAGMPPIDDPNPPRLLVIGMTESVTNHRRLLTLAVRSATPYDVGILNSTWALAGRLDCLGSTTSGTLSATTTSVPLNITDQCVWAHDTGDYDILIGGERMTVTAVGAVAGAYPAQTQTLTVRRSINGVTKTHAAGVAVHIAAPFRLAR